MKKKDLKIVNQMIMDIDNLKNVSIKQKDYIKEIRLLYNDLEDELKKEIKNYKILVDAENKIKEIEDREIYKMEYHISLAIDKQIMASYDLVIKSEINIEFKKESAKLSRFLYDNSSDIVKRFIKEYDNLIELEDYLKYLEKVILDKEIASNIETLIETLNTDITLDMEDEVLEIKNSYDNLNKDAKEYVLNYYLIDNAIKRIEEIKNANVLILMIDNIMFPVELSESEYIESCNKYYNDLNNNEKSLITNYDILEKANNDLTEIINDINDKEVALICENQIALTYETIYSDVSYEYKKSNYDLAKSLFDSLLDKQKEYVSNKDLMESIKEEINRLENIINMKNKALEVSNLINKLPKHIELKDEDIILKSKDAYDKLNDLEKEYVTNYKVLESVMDTYMKKESAFAIIKRINNIKMPITLLDKNEILKINEDFLSLDESEKLYVNNYINLSNALKEINKLEVNKKKALLLIKDINNAKVSSIDDRINIISLKLRYEELDNVSKELVDNINKLKELEELIKYIEQANVFDSMIDLIPIKLTYDYIDEVKDAKAYYDNLSGKAKSYTTKYSLLESLIADSKKLEDKVNRIIKLIDDIGDVEIDEGDEIADARMQYELLDNSLKQYVYNFEKLLDQERSFLKLQSHEENKEVVNSYIDEQIILLNKIIGETNFTKEKKIECIKRVRESYDNLTDNQKKNVKKYQVLVSLEKEIV